MLIHKQSVLLALMGAGLSPALVAQPQTDSLDEIVVTANRTPVPIRQIGSSISIVDEQDIRAHGNFSIREVLRQTPAIGVSSNGGMGAASSLRVRGEEGFRTLMLFDGLRLSDPSAPQVLTPIEHILSSGVNRVEVLRGPQGLSYGADAGGVIAMTSRPVAGGINGSIDAQSGSRGARQAAADFSVAGDSMDLSLMATDFTTDGYNVRASDTVEADDDGYENTSFHGRFGIDVNDRLRLQLVHRAVEGQTQYDGCFSGTIVHDCESNYELNATRLSLDHSSDNFSHSLAYSSSKTDREDFALGASAFGSIGEINRLEYVGSASNLPGFDLVFGIDIEREENGPIERDNQGYYLEYLSDFSRRFYITAGLRRDDNDDFGSHTSYRVSTAYLFNLAEATIKLKTSYGTGFRAPSLFEVDYNAGPFAFAPAAGVALAEETSRGLEYGIEYLRGERLKLEVVMFDQEVEDAIFFDLAGFSGYLQDSGTSLSRGVELSGGLAISPALSLSANYTYNDTERPSGMQRLRRPEQLANLGIRYASATDKFKLNAFYRVSRDSIDEVFGSPVNLDDFEVMDLTASYRLNANIEFYLRIENALDERYQEISDFLAPERASYLGIRVNL